MRDGHIASFSRRMRACAIKSDIGSRRVVYMRTKQRNRCYDAVRNRRESTRSSDISVVTSLNPYLISRYMFVRFLKPRQTIRTVYNSVSKSIQCTYLLLPIIKYSNSHIRNRRRDSRPRMKEMTKE